MELHSINKEDWGKGIKSLLLSYKIYAPLPDGKEPSFLPVDIDNSGTIIYSGFRTSSSIKPFFYPVEEDILSLTPEKDRLIIGVRACDLAALPFLDYIYQELSPADPFYTERRKKTTLVSVDCNDCGPSCWCTILGGKPFAESGFDLNLTFLEKSLVLEIGTKKGKKLLEKTKISLKEVSEEELKERDRLRKKMMEKVKENNSRFSFPSSLSEAVIKGEGSSVWKEFSKTCVQCSGCNLICPTCYCFLFSESKNGKESRLRNWDACMQTGFTRMASGANPRASLPERFRYRYIHKFNYLFQELGKIACTGCGRCIDVCAGKIDIREVLQDLGKQEVNKKLIS